jgi:hypothetical protein
VAKVSRLELAQHELYSARVREFEAWGRQSHPRTDGFGSEYAKTLNSSAWRLLGNFTGEAGAPLVAWTEASSGIEWHQQINQQ